MRFAFPVVFATIALSAAGCGPDLVEPVVPVDGRKVLVVPFSERSQASFDSINGLDLAEAVTVRLTREREAQGDDVPEPIPQAKLQEVLARVDPSTLKPDDIGRRAGANLVVAGQLKKFETKRPGDVGILRGTAEAEVRILDAARTGADGTLYSGTLVVQYPPTEGFDVDSWGAGATTEINEEQMRRALVSLLSKEIAQLLYPHEAEKKTRGAWDVGP